MISYMVDSVRRLRLPVLLNSPTTRATTTPSTPPPLSLAHPTPHTLLAKNTTSSSCTAESSARDSRDTTARSTTTTDSSGQAPLSSSSASSGFGSRGSGGGGTSKSTTADSLATTTTRTPSAAMTNSSSSEYYSSFSASLKQSPMPLPSSRYPAASSSKYVFPRYFYYSETADGGEKGGGEGIGNAMVPELVVPDKAPTPSGKLGRWRKAAEKTVASEVDGQLLLKDAESHLTHHKKRSHFRHLCFWAKSSSTDASGNSILRCHSSSDYYYRNGSNGEIGGGGGGKKYKGLPLLVDEACVGLVGVEKSQLQHARELYLATPDPKLAVGFAAAAHWPFIDEECSEAAMGEDCGLGDGGESGFGTGCESDGSE